jgi:hypothetical protein
VVLVYRDDQRYSTTLDELRALQRAVPPAGRISCDTALALLVAVGEFEAAVADAPPAAARTTTSRMTSDSLRAASFEAARLYLAAAEGRLVDAAALRQRLDDVAARPLPPAVAIRTTEGYAYYALYPESYAVSARRFLRDRSPASVVVVGIRSIGTSLSAVVAAALASSCDVATFTVRPGGHPFDRRLVLDEDLASRWGAAAALGATFAIVDEGPGLSGSSFAAVVDALSGLGVAAERIVLFPSWDPDPARLGSDRARAIWRRHRRYVTDTVDAGISPQRLFGMDGDCRDWSGGRWRSDVCAAHEAPAVQPQHERWKIFAPRERRVIRFAGLGRYGESTRRRAGQLADAGLAAAPDGFRHGFLALPWIEGKIAHGPFTADEAADVGTYIGRRAAVFGIDGAPASSDAIAELVRVNGRELLGEDPPAAAVNSVRDAIAAASTSEIDGRMLRHEWIRTRDGLAKADALDHGSDHFFPGPQHPAWDLAAATLELPLDGRLSARMLESYTRASGDRSAAARLPVYRLAYAAFRAGYAVMAAGALAGTPEAARFDAVRARLSAALRGALTAPSAP